MSEQQFYIDIESSAGVKQGSGPITSASGWTYTARMDKAGSFSFEMAATDAQASSVQKKLIARAYALLNNVWTEVGAGIIDRIEKKPQPDGMVMLRVSGDDLVRELTYRSVLNLKLYSGGLPVTHSAALAAVGAFAPAGWAFTADNAPAHDSIYGYFNGESVLAGICKIAEKSQDHFYRGAGRSIVFASSFTSSGVRAIQSDDDLVAETCAIKDLTEQIDTYDLITRIYPRGSGNAEVQLTLRATNRTAPSGYSLDATANYIENTTAAATYGRIERQADFRDIGPIENTDADIQAAANMLFDSAIETLRRQSTELEQATYTLVIDECSQLLRPMQTIHVSYRDIDSVLAIEADLNILEATWQVDASGVRTIGLVVSNADRWPPTDASTIVENMGQGQVYQALPQLNANSYTTGYTKNVDDTETATFRFRFGNEVVQLQQVLFEFQLLQFESTVKAIGTETGGSGEISTGGPSVDETGIGGNNETGLGGPVATGTIALDTGATALDTAATAINTNTTAINTNTTALTTATTALETSAEGLSTSTQSLNTQTTALGTDTTALGTETAALGTETKALDVSTIALNTSTQALSTATTALSTNTTALDTSTVELSTQTASLSTEGSGELETDGPNNNSTGIAQGEVDGAGRHAHEVGIGAHTGGGAALFLSASGTNIQADGATGSFVTDVTAAHTHSLNSHSHDLSDHTHPIADHSHDIEVSSLTIDPHSHSIAGHSHTIGGHSHDIAAHSHTIAAHSHLIANHSHTIANHSHAIAGHSHTIADHAHVINAHSHTIAAHSHSITDHSHAIAGHSHAIAGHSHSIASHSHAIAAHTHSIAAHSHSLAQHTHSLNNHTHDLSEAIVAIYGIFRETVENTYTIGDLEYRVNSAAFADLSGATDIGSGWFRLDITSQVQNSVTFRPTQEANTLQVRRKAAAPAEKTVMVDVLLSVRNVIQAIVYA